MSPNLSKWFLCLFVICFCVCFSSLHVSLTFFKTFSGFEGVGDSVCFGGHFAVSPASGCGGACPVMVWCCCFKLFGVCVVCCGDLLCFCLCGCVFGVFAVVFVVVWCVSLVLVSLCFPCASRCLLFCPAAPGDIWKGVSDRAKSSALLAWCFPIPQSKISAQTEKIKRAFRLWRQTLTWTPFVPCTAIPVAFLWKAPNHKCVAQTKSFSEFFVRTVFQNDLAVQQTHFEPSRRTFSCAGPRLQQMVDVMAPRPQMAD